MSEALNDLQTPEWLRENPFYSKSRNYGRRHILLEPLVEDKIQSKFIDKYFEQTIMYSEMARAFENNKNTLFFFPGNDGGRSIHEHALLNWYFNHGKHDFLLVYCPITKVTNLFTALYDQMKHRILVNLLREVRINNLSIEIITVFKKIFSGAVRTKKDLFNKMSLFIQATKLVEPNISAIRLLISYHVIDNETHQSFWDNAELLINDSSFSQYGSVIVLANDELYYDHIRARDTASHTNYLYHIVTQAQDYDLNTPQCKSLARRIASRYLKKSVGDDTIDIDQLVAPVQGFDLITAVLAEQGKHTGAHFLPGHFLDTLERFFDFLIGYSQWNTSESPEGERSIAPYLIERHHWQEFLESYHAKNPEGELQSTPVVVFALSQSDFPRLDSLTNAAESAKIVVSAFGGVGAHYFDKRLDDFSKIVDEFITNHIYGAPEAPESKVTVLMYIAAHAASNELCLCVSHEGEGVVVTHKELARAITRMMDPDIVQQVVVVADACYVNVANLAQEIQTQEGTILERCGLIIMAPVSPKDRVVDETYFARALQHEIRTLRPKHFSILKMVDEVQRKIQIQNPGQYAPQLFMTGLFSKVYVR